MVIARVIADETTLSARAEAVGNALGVAVTRLAPDMIELAGDALVAAVRAAVEAQFPLCDALITATAPRLPRVFVSDMDSTMIGQECIDELADFAGLKPQIAAITERAMRGELDFAAALAERVGLLAGLDETAIARTLAERIVPMPGAAELVAGLKARGCHTVLVTGGFHHFADPVAEMLGFDRVVANRLEIAGGRLTGGLIGPIVDSAMKRQVLLDEAHRRGGPTLATGDGANDIPMLQAADYGFATRAKPAARAAAEGWIEHGSLTSVLRLLDPTY